MGRREGGGVAFFAGVWKGGYAWMFCLVGFRRGVMEYGVCGYLIYMSFEFRGGGVRSYDVT